MFGDFLLVGAHLFSEPVVLCLRQAARSRTGDWPVVQPLTATTHQHFGRGADNGFIRSLQQIRVRCGIALAQRAIDGNGFYIHYPAEAL